MTPAPLPTSAATASCSPAPRLLGAPSAAARS
ncbi:hypothetical protein FHR77_001716 [Frigoribacterium endophyticum]|nr:hypothetical protein [Frigoribacterium endophyticum]